MTVRKGLIFIKTYSGNWCSLYQVGGFHLQGPAGVQMESIPDWSLWDFLSKAGYRVCSH